MKKINVLVIGSGGREHALAWKISSSPLCDKLYIAPGNAGTSSYGTNIDIDPEDFEAIKRFVLSNSVDMVVVGPEVPLVKGIFDFFDDDITLKGVQIIGPSGKGAQLEGSKDFAKQFMIRNDIPTARHKTFTSDNMSEARLFLESMDSPYVLKADGLAAGKGVLIIDSLEEALEELNLILSGKFGNAGKKVVVEQFLKGIELSVFVITDGCNYRILPEAKDYKRICEGDTGLNTGGMGAVSPVPFADVDFMAKVEEEIIIPTIDGIKREGIMYRGFIFFGLINVEGKPYVIEYNARLGDPESEVIIPRIKSDFLNLLKMTADGRLKEASIDFDPRCAVTVMVVSGGYPGDYNKGELITGLDMKSDSILFHAGTKTDENGVLTNGGRVIAVTSLADTMDLALDKSYKTVEHICFEGKNFRRDIGFDLRS